MESIWFWGIDEILWLQQFSPALDIPFKLITYMGDEIFFLLLMPFIYWSVDRRIGAELTILFLLSAGLNVYAKLIADQPRPFDYDFRVQKIVNTSSGGFPSGHTQGAVTVWGYLFGQFKAGWFRLAAALLIVFIPLSRLYLGVHFPFDLVGGYLIGIAVLIIFHTIKGGISRWFDAQGMGRQIAVVTLIPFFFILFSGGEPLVVSINAALAGMGVGFILERRWIGFKTAGSPVKRIARFLAGSMVLFMIWGGLKIGFAAVEPEPVFRFIRYLLLGCWGSLGAPWLFVKLRIADRQTA